MTAAHKNLPIPSYAKVTNLDSGKSIVVRVNDRGPFHPGRIIDLSYAAATKLDILRTGTGRVKVESLDTRDAAPPTKVAAAAPATNNNNQMYLQIAAFTELEKANSLAAQLKPHSPHPIQVNQESTLYRVHVGPFDSSNEVNRFKEVLAELGIHNPFITRR
jgi:rare lipoprotein A